MEHHMGCTLGREAIVTVGIRPGLPTSCSLLQSVINSTLCPCLLMFCYFNFVIPCIIDHSVVNILRAFHFCHAKYFVTQRERFPLNRRDTRSHFLPSHSISTCPRSTVHRGLVNALWDHSSAIVVLRCTFTTLRYMQRLTNLHHLSIASHPFQYTVRLQKFHQMYVASRHATPPPFTLSCFPLSSFSRPLPVTVYFPFWARYCRFNALLPPFLRVTRDHSSNLHRSKILTDTFTFPTPHTSLAIYHTLPFFQILHFLSSTHIHTFSSFFISTNCNCDTHTLLFRLQQYSFRGCSTYVFNIISHPLW